MSDSLRPHESQHTRPPCPSLSPGVHSNSHPFSRWCHPAFSCSVVPFSSCPQSLPASESFPVSQLLAWGGQNHLPLLKPVSAFVHVSISGSSSLSNCLLVIIQGPCLTSLLCISSRQLVTSPTIWKFITLDSLYRIILYTVTIYLFPYTLWVSQRQGFYDLFNRHVYRASSWPRCEQSMGIIIKTY